MCVCVCVGRTPRYVCVCREEGVGVCVCVGRRG